MAGAARAGIDYATTHSSGTTHTAPAQTKYVAGAGSSVLINGKVAIVKGDIAACGDKAVGCSTTVFINGKGVHRKGDSLDSHNGTFSPSVCATGSGDVQIG